LLRRASVSEAPVLLEGEYGTGKKTWAEAIHGRSSRRRGPFVVLDCAAIPTAQFEEKLVGSCFRAAASPGALEMARGGTLLLEEVAQVPLAVQAKLVRILDRGHFESLGSYRSRPLDLRLMASTTRGLPFEVKAKRFREELFDSLSILTIRLPPLRERLEDIPPLVEQALFDLGVSESDQASMLRSPAAIAKLERHSWPGNVRELRDLVARVVRLGTPPDPTPWT
jgi:DNA-binding NtrC family response regulator